MFHVCQTSVSLLSQEPQNVLLFQIHDNSCRGTQLRATRRQESQNLGDGCPPLKEGQVVHQCNPQATNFLRSSNYLWRSFPLYPDFLTPQLFLQIYGCHSTLQILIFCYVFTANLSPTQLFFFFLIAFSVYAFTVCLSGTCWCFSRKWTKRQTQRQEVGEGAGGPKEEEGEPWRGRARDSGRWPGTRKYLKTRTRERGQNSREFLLCL